MPAGLSTPKCRTWVTKLSFYLAHPALPPSSLNQVFGPAFRRNARWSVDPKVPDLGEEGAPWEEVDKFYDFWFGFK